MDQPPQISGQKKKNLNLTRDEIRKHLLLEKERESQEPKDGIKRMTPETRTINSRRVTFVGASHIFNASETEKQSLKQQLDATLDEFATETQNNPVTYIIEGEIPKDQDLENLPDHEAALVVKKAKQSSNPDVKYISGDPNKAELFSRIKDSSEFTVDLKKINIEGFGEFNNSDLALLYFFFRDCKLEDSSPKNIIFLINFVSQFQNTNFFKSEELQNIVKSIENANKMTDSEKTAFLAKIQPFINQILEKIKKVQEYFEKQYPGMSVSEIIENYDSENNSNPQENLRSGVYQMATIVRRERDVYLLEKIQAETQDNRDVITVFGSSHQIRTRKALDMMTEKE